MEQEEKDTLLDPEGIDLLAETRASVYAELGHIQQLNDEAFDLEMQAENKHKLAIRQEAELYELVRILRHDPA